MSDIEASMAWNKEILWKFKNTHNYQIFILLPWLKKRMRNNVENGN